MEISERMTGDELATMRQACGLSRGDLATVVDVQNRTVKFWENGRIPVPQDVADVIRAGSLAAAQLRESVDHGEILLMFTSYTDFNRFAAPYSVDSPKLYGWIVRGMLANYPGARAVWMNTCAYDAWRGDRPDDLELRQAWAAGQVAVQAMPRPGAQPAG
jgi:DNA-binding XRE family transcriptional regulator